MSLVRVAQSVRPDKIGQPPSEIEPDQEDNEMWIPAMDNTGPFGNIGSVANSGAYASWFGGRAQVFDDGANEGFACTRPIPVALRGTTVEVFLCFMHRSATATGDIVVQLDAGPRQDAEAAGAPNDAASARTTTTIEAAASAADKQDAERYVSLGTFDIGADDVVLIFNCQRLGADVSDTFTASIYGFGAYILPA